MRSFLQHIVDDISEQHLAELKDWCFVFPSKRAGLYFESLLSTKFKENTYWSPKILGIEDFVYESLHTKPSDEITLIFHLFQVYQSLDKNLEFEKFYSWGQILLNDFDEIDRHLVDAQKMYKGLASRAEIDAMFGENEELKDAYARFTELFDGDDPSELTSRFIKNWNKVYEAYRLFDHHLTTTGTAYAGRLFRQLSEQPIEPSSYPFKRVIFAGFNALSKSEEEIIKNSLTAGIGEVYWDCDQLYMRNDNEEAGQFLRQYKKYWKYDRMHWIETNLLEEKKNIWSIGCPQSVAQAKYANKILQDGDLALEDTAVILGDELLMMPTLNALDVEKVNVTMGYPIKSTSIYHFIEETIRLHSTARASEKQVLLESQRIISLIKSPLISPVFRNEANVIARSMRRDKLKWAKVDDAISWCEGRWLELIFTHPKSYKELLANIRQFLVKLFYYLKEEQEDETSQEIIYYGLKYLVRFEENLAKQPFEPSLAFLGRIFNESFRSIKVPFSGEPLQGLQVMGFLESRALDFKNVLLLGVNENKLPRTATGNSYIPFSARKAFHLPTADEQQAIYAYHFKRVLQRAENVWMLYDTETAVDGSGEKSRFILQLLNSSRKYPPFKIQEKTISVPYESYVPTHTVTVEKTPDVLSKLDEYLDNKLISPSRLVIYIDCKLRFYLQYVAKVPEKDPEEIQIDPRTFGNIVHHAMELAYKPFEGKTLASSDIDAIGEQMPQYIQESMREAKVVHKTYHLHGVDVLLESVIHKLCQRILDEDRKNLPFSILGVEQNLEHHFQLPNGKQVRLGGVVDRIDQEKDGSQTIIDYKSGRVDMLYKAKAEVPDAARYLDPYFTDGKYKSGFQTYFYMLIRSKTTNEPLKGAIYELKKLGKGKKYLRNAKPLPEDFFGQMESRLMDLIGEILNPDVPFEQTENLSKCSYCPYVAICQR